jgi:hypothetical protein
MAWESICRRLCLQVHPSVLSRRFRIPPGRTIDFQSEKPFHGIFFYLFEKYSGNPHSDGVIVVSAPDEHPNRTFQCEDLISHEAKTGKCWGTKSTNSPHYLQIDFKDLQILPSAYSVKAHNSSWSSTAFVKSWEFEGSTWHCLDRHFNCADLCQNDAVASYHISNSSVFRYLRFRMTEQDSSKSWYFSLQQIEVFGTLIGEDT